jgi:hypothetical protein
MPEPVTQASHDDAGLVLDAVVPRRSTPPLGWVEIRGLTDDGTPFARWFPADHPSATGLAREVAARRERMAARRALVASIDTPGADPAEIARLRAAATVPPRPYLSYERLLP